MKSSLKFKTIYSSTTKFWYTWFFLMATPLQETQLHACKKSRHSSAGKNWSNHLLLSRQSSVYLYILSSLLLVTQYWGDNLTSKRLKAIILKCSQGIGNYQQDSYELDENSLRISEHSRSDNFSLCPNSQFPINKPLSLRKGKAIYFSNKRI